MQIQSNNKNSNGKGQTAIELAVFGAVLVFIIGAIVQQSMTANHFQDQQLKVLRMAMLESHMFSEGLKGTGRVVKCGGNLNLSSAEEEGDGTRSRNTASVMLIEDRLSVGSAKYAEINRSPYVAQANATHSRNIYLPLDPGECHNLPIFDMYINGIHFPFLLSDFARHTVAPDPNDGQYYVYAKIPNHASFSAEWDTSDESFDLDRDGDADVPPARRGLLIGGIPTNGNYFSWQWHKVRVGTESFEEIAAYDVDGDLKEETILDVAQGSLGAPVITVVDSQEGDVDFTSTDYDALMGQPEQGVQRENMEMYTRVKRGDGGAEGTYLLIEEGKLFALDDAGGQEVRSVRRKDQIDVISRAIRLSRNTGRFCSLDYRVRQPTVDGGPNPVEVCVPQASLCYETANIDKTCMAPDPGGLNEVTGDPRTVDLRKYPLIYVRSRIEDRRGRKWLLKVDRDPTVGFLN